MCKVLVVLIAVASLSLPPMYSMTVVGAADTYAHVGDVIQVRIPVNQIDVDLSSLSFAIPYDAKHLEFVEFEDATQTVQTNTVVVNDVGSLNVSWSGIMEAGSVATLGTAKFRVVKSGNVSLSFIGVNPIAKDIAGNQLQKTQDINGNELDPVEMVRSSAVHLLVRPIKVNFELL